MEVEFKTEAEHEEDHADLRQSFDLFGVADDHGEKLRHGTQQKAGENIADDHRLFQFFADQRRDPGDDQDQRQIGNEHGKMSQTDTSFGE